jgi:hypothetical protein
MRWRTAFFATAHLAGWIDTADKRVVADIIGLLEIRSAWI